MNESKLHSKLEKKHENGDMRGFSKPKKSHLSQYTTY